MNRYKTGRVQRALITSHKLRRTQLWKNSLWGNKNIWGGTAFSRGIWPWKRHSCWKKQETACTHGAEGRETEFHSAPVERAFTYPMASVRPNLEEKILWILRSPGENNSAAFAIFCILVSIILFSNLNSCCGKNWNKSASDCYHDKILCVKCSQWHRTHFLWLASFPQYS